MSKGPMKTKKYPLECHLRGRPGGATHNVAFKVHHRVVRFVSGQPSSWRVPLAMVRLNLGVIIYVLFYGN